MRPAIIFLCTMLTLATAIATSAQEPDPQSLKVRGENPEAETTAASVVTLPAGTKIPLVLRQGISTKNSQVGDPVYAQTNFPVTQDNRIVIPAGTYVQGVISEIKHPGRIKGRASVLFHFTSMILPSGYTIQLPGSVDNVPDAQHAKVKGQEGAVQQEGEKGKDIKTAASTTATGAAIGGLASQSGKGVGIGAGVGGATGLAIALLTRGSDVRLENGTGVEMVLSRPLTFDPSRVPR